MNARDPFPILYVRSVERSEAFYRDAFGFEARYRFPASGPARFVYLHLEPSGIGLGVAEGARTETRFTLR